MTKIEAFRAECLAIGKNWLCSGYKIKVEGVDHELAVGVAIETPWGLRTAVRGQLYDRLVYPPWYLFWRKPIHAPAITPRRAMAKLIEWAIINQRNVVDLTGNGEFLGNG